jgi:hypothetical protein
MARVSQRCSKKLRDIIHMISFQIPPKTILQSYQKFHLQLKLFRPSFTFETRRHLTKSKYSRQHVVMIFGELHSRLGEADLTRTYRDDFRFCKLENIGYLVSRYLHTREPPFKEWAQEWLENGEVWSSFTKEMWFGALLHYGARGWVLG